MVKKATYSTEEIALGYKAFAHFRAKELRDTSEEAFQKFRYRKYFIELGKQYTNNGTTIPLEKLVDYVQSNNVPAKDWGNLTTFRNFLLIHIKEEDKDTALKRSTEFLASKGTNIAVISDSRLTLYLESGCVSPWLIIKEYPEFFEEIHKSQGNQFAKNLLSYYFWKLKTKELVNE